MRPFPAVAVIVTILAIASTPSVAHTQAREAIGTSSPTLTPAIRVGNMVYSSGQLGITRNDPDTTIQGQTRRSLENIKRVFEQAGTTMALAVKCTVFLVDVTDFQGMNQVYGEFWPTSPPARSTVVVKALVAPAAKIEIECMAAMPAR
jgi:2-iminobutanoate/2-iminopropanoate deaminase